MCKYKRSKLFHINTVHFIINSHLCVERTYALHGNKKYILLEFIKLMSLIKACYLTLLNLIKLMKNHLSYSNTKCLISKQIKKNHQNAKFSIKFFCLPISFKKLNFHKYANQDAKIPLTRYFSSLYDRSNLHIVHHNCIVVNNLVMKPEIQ